MRPQQRQTHLQLRRLSSTVLAALLILGVLAPITFASSTAIPGFGVIEVRTEPPVAATIAVDGEVRNTGRLRHLLLPVGEYEVSFGQVNGFLAPPAVSATIRDGDVTEIVGRFSPAGLVDIRIDPPDLEPLITVDGEVRDRGVVNVPVAAGSTEICAAAIDGNETPICVTTEVVADEIVPVTLSLRPEIPTVEDSATPGTAFAALLSEDELELQRTRAANGPFRVPGDFSANSPGHWTEMAATMRLDFSSARWEGPTRFNADGSVQNLHTLGQANATANDPPHATRRMAHDMMSAAYAAAITDNHEVAAAITREIEYQATRPNLDYSNTTRWPRLRNGQRYYRDVNPLFMHAAWVRDYVLAYDITKAMGHTSPSVEQWFLNLAELNEWALHADIGGVWPRRRSNVYDPPPPGHHSMTVRRDTRDANGSPVDYLRGSWVFNNRRCHQAGLVGLVGVVLDNNYYKEEFKRYVREWVMFGHRASDGYKGDANRGTDSFPQLGFSYSLRGMDALIPAMDALARQGDTSLYEFSSSNGLTSGSIGTNQHKTMEDVLDSYVRWIRGTMPRQYTAGGSPPTNSIVGNPSYRIRSRTNRGNEIIHDAALLMPANYYNRMDWHDAVMRIGTPTGFTRTPHVVGGMNGWRSDWRHRFLRSLDTDPYPTRGSAVR